MRMLLVKYVGSVGGKVCGYSVIFSLQTGQISF